MRITINNVKHEWKSPDGRVNIWSLTDQDGKQWQTRSGKIAGSENQTMEVVIKDSNGRKYLVQPVAEDSPYAQKQAYQPPAQQAQVPVPAVSEDMITRAEAAIEAFVNAVDKFTERVEQRKDMVPTEIPKDIDDALTKRMQQFSGDDIQDDLP